ncbi:hypothetical protein ACU21_00185 [Actinobaculum suis]|nr:hypothetical protein ACU20_00185 [Actinobaculum suis]OCA95836.1 hypothetical protein ACU21_00185 [Actinobaculum suis]
MNERILVAGEALIDSIAAAGQAPREVVGGSLFNVAGGLARLGVPTDFATWFGKDARGQQIAAHARKLGVRIVPGSAQATATSVAHARLDADGKASYTFEVESDIPTLENLGDIGHVHIGSYSAVVSPSGEKIAALAAAQARRATISYDPNCRPDLMGDPDAARKKIMALVELADIVKVSDEDLHWLYPGLALSEILAQWAQISIPLLVVTRGAEPALVSVRGKTPFHALASRKVPVGDTVGAGDSFMAGLLTGLYRDRFIAAGAARERLRQTSFADFGVALQIAQTCAAITVSANGAYAPTRAEVAAAF